MPATTPDYSLPYPLPAEPVAEGAAAIRSLAEAVEAALNLGPLARAEIMAPVTIFGTTLAAANPIVTAPELDFDGSDVLVTFFAPIVTPAAASGAIAELFLFDYGSAMGALGQIKGAAGGVAIQAPVFLRRRISLSAAKHQLSVKGLQSGGNATVTAGDGVGTNFVPAFLRIEREHPVSPFAALLPSPTPEPEPRA